MFLPLGLEHSYERRPLVTMGLIGVNAGVAVLVWTHGKGAMEGYALDPEEFRVHQLLTSPFLHAGVVHLLANMLFLWIFGRYVEDRLGARRFALLYFACAVAGGLAHLLFGGARPAVGASGAVAGLMGYVLVAAPWLEVNCVLFVSYYAKQVEIAAGWLLGFWVLLQLVEASLGQFSDVAVAAHLGGFGLGAAAAGVMRSHVCLGTSWYIDPRPPQGGRAAVERLRHARGGPP